MDLKSKIREVPDWPKKGVNFKDITTLLEDKDAFQSMVNQMTAFFMDTKADKIVGHWRPGIFDRGAGGI